jgi:hypothetical protein
MTLYTKFKKRTRYSVIVNFLNVIFSRKSKRNKKKLHHTETSNEVSVKNLITSKLSDV